MKFDVREVLHDEIVIGKGVYDPEIKKRKDIKKFLSRRYIIIIITGRSRVTDKCPYE